MGRRKYKSQAGRQSTGAGAVEIYKSQAGRQSTGVGAVELSCPSRVISKSLKQAAKELVSVPLGLQREAKSQAGRQGAGVGAVGTTARRKVSKLAASELVSVPLGLAKKVRTGPFLAVSTLLPVERGRKGGYFKDWVFS